MSEKRLLTSSEVAARFGVGRACVVRWAKLGIGPKLAIRTPGPHGRYRWREEDVDAWIAEHGTQLPGAA